MCSITTMHRYPFALSFENKFAPGYTTEKFFDALGQNSIPVVLSSPDILRYAPTPNAFINAADFASPQHLASFMQHVRHNASLFQSFFEWRKNPAILSSWRRRFPVDRHGATMACGICEAYMRKWGCHLLDPQPTNCPTLSSDLLHLRANVR